MTDAARQLKTPYADYLSAELVAEVKHEYIDGEIYAMSGGTIAHSLIAANMIGVLGNLLLDRPCVVLNSNVRVRVVAANVGTYPDVSVVCIPIVRAVDDRDAVTNPLVLVEVLSDSTEANDRGEKFGYYRRIPSLREYVLVSQHEPRVEVYQRTDGKRWTLTEYTAEENFPLESLGIAVSVSELYRKVADL